MIGAYAGENKIRLGFVLSDLVALILNVPCGEELLHMIFQRASGATFPPVECRQRELKKLVDVIPKSRCNLRRHQVPFKRAKQPLFTLNPLQQH